MTDEFSSEMQMLSMPQKATCESNDIVALLKSNLKDSEESRIKLLEEVVFLKRTIQKMADSDDLKAKMTVLEAKYKKATDELEKFSNLKNDLEHCKNEIHVLRESVIKTAKSSEYDKLLEENKKLKKQIKDQEENQKLLEEIKQLSKDTDASSAFYSELEELQSENEILKQKLEQKKSISQLLDSQLVTIQNSAATLSPHEVYIALKFRLRQLSDENRDLRGDSDEEEEEEDMEICNEENMKNLRERVNDLQNENVVLRGGSTPPRTSTSFMANLDNVLEQIQVLKEKNAQLKELHMKPVAKMQCFTAFKKSVHDLKNGPDMADVERKVETLQMALRELIAEIYENEENEDNEIDLLKKQVETLFNLCHSLATQNGCQALVHENIVLNEELRRLKEELSSKEHVQGHLSPLSDPYQLP
jgi:myosin heavy subunit